MVQTMRMTLSRSLGTLCYYMRNSEYTLEEAVRAYFTTVESAHLDAATETELTNLLLHLADEHKRRRLEGTLKGGSHEDHNV